MKERIYELALWAESSQGPMFCLSIAQNTAGAKNKYKLVPRRTWAVVALYQSVRQSGCARRLPSLWHYI